MFTGIIEEIGTVKDIIRHRSSIRINIEADKVLENLAIDHSISINGVCLTVVGIDHEIFSVDAVTETLAKTTLFKFKKNDKVNLERALRIMDRLGGHLVQGHVDAVDTIRRMDIRPEGGTVVVEIPDDLLCYTITKGSIAIDGVSLTIAEKNANLLTIAIIPHTIRQTIFQFKKPGDQVNIEVDFLAKYIEQFLNKTGKSKINSQWLKQQGFY